MVALRVVACLLLLGCADARQHADSRWLINESTEQVMGLLGRSSNSESSIAQHFILMECSSYDLFAAASEAYYRHLDVGKFKQIEGCQLLVGGELSKEELLQSKKELAQKLKKKNVTDTVLNDLTSGAYSGAVFSLLGVSSTRNSKLIAGLVRKLKELKIFPTLPGGGKVQKGLIIISTIAMLVTSSGILKQHNNEGYQMMLDELSGAEYNHRLRDQFASAENYQEIRKQLIALVEGQVSPLDG